MPDVSNKPEAEMHDAAGKPVLKDMASGPAERAVLGRMGPWGFVGVVGALLTFILVAGSVFYFLQG